MHATIADKKSELVELCQHYSVARLDIFGSAARGTDFDPNTSDADFIVEFHRSDKFTPFIQFFEFADALERTLNRSVDLVELAAVDNPYLRDAINHSRELIYES